MPFSLFTLANPEVLQYSNLDLENVISPVNYSNLESLLKESAYDPVETAFLVDGFKNGFDLGYRGEDKPKIESKNLKFTIGNEVELWNKVMKEVQLKRYAGPFENIPFEHYIQSPIGLVPKDGGKKTRLIFHLSYPRRQKDDPKPSTSINANTPDDMKSVKYKDIDKAIMLCLKEGKSCYLGKSDMSSAFRHFGLAKRFWKFLVMKAKNPNDGKFYFFVDKCMPFGAAISCSHFQRFSNAVAHIVSFKTKKDNVNYLDDFLFIALLKWICNNQMKTFLEVCQSINFPVALEKTFWASQQMSFLGLLIDTINQVISIPVEKVQRAINMINSILTRKSKKTTKLEIQQLTGFLNFLCRAVIPGRAFTRRIYAAAAHLRKDHHHLPVSQELRLDLEMWLLFLNHSSAYARSFLDYDTTSSTEIDLYTDASTLYGCGGHFGPHWFIIPWDEEFLQAFSPSINYLELYAVTVAVLNWAYILKNKRIILFCDNTSVVQMINVTSSKCKNCMVLIRLLVVHSMKYNVKISAKHVPGAQNNFADLMSRLKYKDFRKLARKQGKTFDKMHTPIPDSLWPMFKLWLPTSSEEEEAKKKWQQQQLI